MFLFCLRWAHSINIITFIQSGAVSTHIEMTSIHQNQIHEHNATIQYRIIFWISIRNGREKVIKRSRLTAKAKTTRISSNAVSTHFENGRRNLRLAFDLFLLSRSSSNFFFDSILVFLFGLFLIFATLNLLIFFSVFFAEILFQFFTFA